MTTQAERIVRVTENENGTGRRHAMTEHDFKHKKLASLGGQTYQDAGYHIFSYEDGTAYEAGSKDEPTKFAIAAQTGPEIGDVPEGTNVLLSHEDSAFAGTGATVATEENNAPPRTSRQSSRASNSGSNGGHSARGGLQPVTNVDAGDTASVDSSGQAQS